IAKKSHITKVCNSCLRPIGATCYIRRVMGVFRPRVPRNGHAQLCMMPESECFSARVVCEDRPGALREGLPPGGVWAAAGGGGEGGVARSGWRDMKSGMKFVSGLVVVIGLIVGARGAAADDAALSYPAFAPGLLYPNQATSASNAGKSFLGSAPWLPAWMA